MKGPKSTCNIDMNHSKITGTFMHHRKRHIEVILSKRAKIFPVLGVLGPRQVGKSTFLMKQWRERKSAVYITFDNQAIAMRAKHSPEQLLLDETHHQKVHLIIDEAQKVPHIFDSIKALVDANRRVGAFTLSGSVEFSSKSGVRESLAGRMGITRLYPLTIREMSNQSFSSPWVTFDFASGRTLKAKSIETWLLRGGMPIFCGISDADERINLINSWLEAICFRDLKQLKDANYDSEIALTLLKVLAADSRMSINQLASELGTSALSIKKHLSALESIFLIYKIPSFENPRAHPVYRLFDAGVLNALLGGHQNFFSRHSCLITLLINEIYAQYEYAGKLKPQLYYYRARGGAAIDLVLQTNQTLIGIEGTTSIEITPYKQRGMKSFLSKYKQAKGYFIAPVQESYKLDNNLFVIPWDWIS
ncbi:ATPase [Coxiella burnetii]|uniref:ATP-binding protein n=1 Tax=Coxiella burnetii TaxID=777 RepID=UPI000C03BC6C|nr:AAA family ATPase [Coxiella burnetii]ATN66202.1 ATPase [Coxiella burnetii]